MTATFGKMFGAGPGVAEGNRKKILFANIPADGHFNPLTGLARHLKEEGHDVRWYTGQRFIPKIKTLGISCFPFRKAKEVTVQNIDDVFPQRRAIRSPLKKLRFDINNYFILRGPEFFEDIKDIYQEFPFDLMIADITFTAIPMVREKLKLPVMAIGVLPLMATSKDLPPSGLALTPSYTWLGKKKSAFLRFLADKVLLKECHDLSRKVLQEQGIDSGTQNSFDTIVRSASVVLQSATPGFEYQRSDLSPNVHFAGPLLPHTSRHYSPLPFEDKLLKYDKVILVTQGTFEPNPSKLIIPALEAFKNSDKLVVVTTGGWQTAELRRRYPHDNCIIEDFLPFGQIMPYADVYVSNGGYGGVMLSIANKLPMVVAGVHEGKNEINARVGYFGLGINLKTERPAIRQLRNAVAAVLGSPDYQRNVEVLAEEFSRYRPLDICSYYVNELTNKVSKN